MGIACEGQRGLQAEQAREGISMWLTMSLAGACRKARAINSVLRCVVLR